MAELLQVEAVGEFEHAFEAGLQIGPVLALPGLDFGSAEQVVLVGGNAPLQFKLERAMVQRYQIAQVVADLVDRGDRVLQELVESRQLRPDPREAALAVLFVHLGEGPLEQLQTTAHVLLDGRLEIAWKSSRCGLSARRSAHSGSSRWAGEPRVNVFWLPYTSMLQGISPRSRLTIRSSSSSVAGSAISWSTAGPCSPSQNAFAARPSPGIG